MKEVIAMYPQLQAFEQRYEGFVQFCHRYERVCENPDVRRDYAMWYNEQLRQQSMLEWARNELIGEYELKIEEAERARKEAERARKEAERARKEAVRECEEAERACEEAERACEEFEQEKKNEFLNAARVMKNSGMANAIIASALPLSLEEIDAL